MEHTISYLRHKDLSTLGKPGTKRYKKGHRQYMREYWQSRPEKYLWSSARTRARKNGIPFDIEIEDVIIPQTCPILGIEIGKPHNGPISDGSPTLDRRDPEKGYTKGNVFVISYAANRYKSNMTKETIKKLYNYVFEAP